MRVDMGAPGVRRRVVVTSVAVIVLVAVPVWLGSCAALTPGPSPDGVSGTPSDAAPSDVFPVAPVEAGDEDLRELPVPNVRWDRAAATSAGHAAVSAMSAFVRPADDADTWWAGLVPHLSDTARVAYAGTDPVNIPASRVDGLIGEVRSSSPFLATAVVSTDAGPYEVLLVRDETGTQWLIERFVPPPDDPLTLAPSPT